MKRTIVTAIISILCISAYASSVASSVSDSTAVQAFSQPHRGPVYARKHSTANLPWAPAGKRLVTGAVSRSGQAAPATNLNFLAANPLAAGGNNYYRGVLGDYNHDGQMDVATVVSSNFGATYSLSVMLGQGDGSFANPVLTAASFAMSDRMYAADLNQDSFDDLIVVHGGSVEVFLGRGDGTFSPPVSYSDGVGNPVAVSLSDVNADGKIDLMVTDGITQPNLAPPMVATLLGNGDGTFQAATLAGFPGQALNAVFADVNGDGALDLISSSEVFLANGSGGFLPGVSLAASNGQPNSCEANEGAVVVADVNGDGFRDIVTADCENNTVTVFLNNGDGTFQPGSSYFAGHYPQGVSVADLNGDGAMDIVSANSDSSDITVLTGDNTGTFQSARMGYTVGGNAWAQPVTADFNKDGKIDVIAANDVEGFSFSLMFLRGLGDGTLVAARDYYSPAAPAGESDYGVGVASADFNGDGRPDFVVGNAASISAGVTVFVANPDGTLQSGINYGSSANLNLVATGDFNGDGNQDIVASDALTGEVDLFLGRGDGTFNAPQVFSAIAGPAGRIVAGDFNRDGKPDVAVTGWRGSLAVLLNDGTGTLLPPAVYNVAGGGFEMAVADINGDGNLDLLIPNQSGSTLAILLGVGDGTFNQIADADLGSSYLGSVAAGGLNNDGKIDIAATVVNFAGNTGILVAMGNGDGTFQPATLYPATTRNSGLNPFPTGVQIADMDLDGNRDLVYDNTLYGTVGMMLGSGSGAMASPIEYPAAGFPYELVTSDVNGDGALDVVTVDHNSPGVVVMLDGAGSASSLVSAPNPSASGENVTLTATVSAAVSGVSGVPGGSVSFMEGATVLGTSPLSGGVASMSLTSLTAGSHLITANYSGDSSFVPSVSLGVTQVVTSGGAAQPDYSLDATPTSVTIHHGKSANFTITVTPLNGYNGSVNFSCGGVPTGVTCQFSPASVKPTNGPVQLTLTVTAAATMSAAAQPNRSGRGLPPWAVATTGLFGFVLVEGMGNRRRRALMVGIAILALVAMLSLAGCGGSSAAPAPGLFSVPSDTVQVLATGTGGNSGGNAVHELDLTVTVK